MELEAEKFDLGEKLKKQKYDVSVLTPVQAMVTKPMAVLRVVIHRVKTRSLVVLMTIRHSAVRIARL